MRIMLEAFGEALLDRTLLRFATRADNMRPVLAQLAEDFYDVEVTQFATEGGRSGGWASLRPSTVASKRRQGYGNRGILERTLDLEESLTSRTHQWSIYRVTGDELWVGTRAPYAIFHQKGFRHWISGQMVPARPVVELSEADKRGMVKRVQRYLVDGTVVSGDFRVMGL